MKKLTFISALLIGTLAYGGLLEDVKEQEKETTKTEEIASLDLSVEVKELVESKPELMQGFIARNIHYKGQNYVVRQSQELTENAEMVMVATVSWEDPEAWGFGKYLLLIIGTVAFFRFVAIFV